MSVITKLVDTKVTEASQTTQKENINYQVVHSIPGRFRIRIPRLAEDSEYASKLKDLLESLDFVSSVRINPIASSLVVKYNDKANTGAIATLQEQIFNAIQIAPLTDICHLPTPVEQQPSSCEIKHQESAARFFKSIQQNEALKAKLKATNDPESFVKIAAAHGYNFTVEQLQSEIEKLSPEEVASVINPGVGPRHHLVRR